MARLSHYPEMLGYVLVIPSSYYGRVGRDGRYAIGDVPPGTYKANLWIPRLPASTRTVTVGAGATAANFEVAASPPN